MGNRRSWKARQLSSAHRLFFWVAALALTVITLDGMIESGRFGFTSEYHPGLAENLGTIPENHQVELEVQYVDIPIDHHQPMSRTFKNRYWVNDVHYRPGGPVIVYDSGEGGDGSQYVERFLQRESSFVVELLKEFGGVGILWEHRYYGQSKPYRLDKNTPVEAFNYLTLDQSLRDLPYFANRFSLSSLPETDLRPSSTPWVMVGCSYSGTRAALSRLLFPETIYAAYAGSAPAKFQAAVPQYYNGLYQSLVDHGWENCAKDLHRIVEHVDGLMDDSRQAWMIKTKILGAGAERNDNKDFAMALFSVHDSFKGHGLYEGDPTVSSFCEYLEWDPIRNQKADSNGLAPFHGTEFLIDRLASWDQFLPHVNKRFNTTCGDTNVPVAQRCDLSGNPLGEGDGLSWLWQQCTQFGWFPVQNTGAHSLVSKFIALDQFTPSCREAFGIAWPGGLAEYTARIDQTNLAFGGLAMRPSNTFWTTGEYDPWRSVTPLARSELESDSMGIVASDQIPKCNATMDRGELFGVVLPDAGHCAVIAKNTTDVMKSRRLFADALREWFKCF